MPLFAIMAGFYGCTRANPQVMDGQPSGMGRYRAILTDTDREYLQDMPEDRGKRDQSVSRARMRIKELKTDVEILEEHHPQLLKELREVVCPGSE